MTPTEALLENALQDLSKRHEKVLRASSIKLKELEDENKEISEALATLSEQVTSLTHLLKR